MSKSLKTEIKINNTELSVKEYKGQRVVTFKDIDTVHGRPEGTADRNFRQNKDKFIENEDYFCLSKSQNHEIRGLEIPNRGITVITEQGYLMLVKSFTDDLAWKVQRELVKSYFRNKGYDSSDNNVDRYNTKNDNASTYSIPNTLLYHNTPVITTTELAKHYDTTKQNISVMFGRYKEWFREGKHYFLLAANEETAFRKEHRLGTTSKLYLWTRKGSLMFTKVISNEIGWGNYCRILDILFERMEENKKVDNSIDNIKSIENTLQLPNCTDVTLVSQLKPQSNWYLKNSYKIERICKALDMEIKEFNHLILTKIQEKYDMGYIGELYKDKNGSTPEYALDIISHFPELSKIADDLLSEYMLSVIDKFSLVKDMATIK